MKLVRICAVLCALLACVQLSQAQQAGAPKP